MTSLRGELLGQAQIWRNNSPVGDFGYDKVRALLVYLWVEAERPHHRDTLAAMLWPDATDNRARTNLRKALSTLRRVIGDHKTDQPLLLVARDTLQFNPDANSALDVATFRELTTQVTRHHHTFNTLCSPCAQKLEQAAQLYRGDFLDDSGMRESSGFAEWAMTMRETLHQTVVEGLTLLATYHEQWGALDAAQRSLRQLLTLELWDEAAHRAMMRVLAKRGQRGAALQQFERCRHLLDADLGLEPEAATMALREQICSGTLVARAA